MKGLNPEMTKKLQHDAFVGALQASITQNVYRDNVHAAWTRLSFRNTLDVCINPLDNEYHPDGAHRALMNIMTGQTANPDVNADNALTLGQHAMTDLKSG